MQEFEWILLFIFILRIIIIDLLCEWEVTKSQHDPCHPHSQ